MPPFETKNHIKRLQDRHGLSLELIARASGISAHTINRIIKNRAVRVRSTTEERVLAVIASDKSIHAMPMTLLKSTQAIRLMEEMHQAGFSYRWLMTQTKWTDYHTAKKNGRFISAMLAKRVRQLHDDLWKNNTESWISQGNPMGSKKILTGKTLRDTCKCFKGTLDKRSEPRKNGSQTFV